MRKSIILLTANLKLGGQERVAVNTAEILKDCYNVLMVTFDESGCVYQTDSEILSLNVPARKGVFNKAINVIIRIMKLNKLIRDRNIDIVYSFGTSANIVNAGATVKKKTILSIHGYEFASLNCIERILYKRADNILCVSKLIADTLNRYEPKLRKKISTLYNPYNIKEMEKLGMSSVDDYTFTPHTIVSHGRLDEVKNWPRLIKAYAIVKKSVKDAKLLIIGEGNQRKLLEQMLLNYGLNGDVTLIGFRSNPFRYLSKSSIYVLPSYAEGFPNSLIEGMVFLPAISVDCKSGPREILSDTSIFSETCETNDVEISEYGILVRQAVDRQFHSELMEDDVILAKAILDVLQNPELALRIKKLAHKRVEQYSFDQYRTQIVKIIEG